MKNTSTKTEIKEQNFKDKWYLTNSRPIKKGPTTKQESKPNKTKLKVIAWKLPESLLDGIKESNKNQISASISEFSRTAIFDLLQLIVDNQISDMELSDHLDSINQMQEHKFSACAKMPVEFLNVLDRFVELKKSTFLNRTNLIRVAIKIGLETERDMLNYYKESFGVDICPHCRNRIKGILYEFKCDYLNQICCLCSFDGKIDDWTCDSCKSNQKEWYKVQDLLTRLGIQKRNNLIKKLN